MTPCMYFTYDTVRYVYYLRGRSQEYLIQSTDRSPDLLWSTSILFLFFWPSPSSGLFSLILLSFFSLIAIPIFVLFTAPNPREPLIIPYRTTLARPGFLTQLGMSASGHSVTPSMLPSPRFRAIVGSSRILLSRKTHDNKHRS